MATRACACARAAGWQRRARAVRAHRRKRTTADDRRKPEETPPKRLHGSCSSRGYLLTGNVSKTVGRVLSKVSRLGETHRGCEGETGATRNPERSLSDSSPIYRWLSMLDRKLDIFSNTSLMSAEQIERNHRAVRERSRTGATSYAATRLHHSSRFHLTLP